MKALRIYLVIGILCVVFIACQSGKPGEQNTGHTVYQLSSIEKSRLKEGDIILRQGYGFVSNSIVKLLSEDIPLSHVGIIVNNERQEFSVIHSLSQRVSDKDGIQQESLEMFVRNSRPGSLVVVRYKPAASNTQLQQSISFSATSYLEQNIPFDYGFDLDDASKFYCSELVARVLSDVFGQKVFDSMYPDEKTIMEKLRFEIFLNPRFFEVIINHQTAV